MATEILEKHGYIAIGMDHFARPDDELAKAVKDGRLIRNFMGYAVQAGSDSLGFGPSAIANVGGVYAQNEKILAKWERAVTDGHFAPSTRASASPKRTRCAAGSSTTSWAASSPAGRS